MKKEEFIEKINEAGLGGKVFIKPNKYTGGPYSLGCFYDGINWIAYENNERGKHEDLIRTPSEDDAFQLLYDYMIRKTC